MWLYVFYSYNLEKDSLHLKFKFLTHKSPPVELNSSPIAKNLARKFHSYALPVSLKEVTTLFCETKYTTLQKLGSKGFLAEHLILHQVILLAERGGGVQSRCLYTSCHTDFVLVAQVTTFLPHSYTAKSLKAVGRHSNERRRGKAKKDTGGLLQKSLTRK